MLFSGKRTLLKPSSMGAVWETTKFENVLKE